jgi:asparagine synthase (glutamine-hydrolysing)
MVRRGPDDSGAWQDERCNLVFRRLSILDLSDAGHQPMVSGDGRHVLVFNGEVYNFTDLRRQLEQRGVRFRSNSDSEVVLYSLVEWGREALDRFNGMFALGFYDTRERKLLLARDHAGDVPHLRWYGQGDCLHRGSGSHREDTHAPD